MNLIKCENEHYFDADKFDSCPHCANQAVGVEPDKLLGEQQQKIETAKPADNVSNDYQKSVHRPCVGWLVCISGEMKGDSFTLYSGTNHIGRAANMDVTLFREPTVSRIDHAVIKYEDTDNTFKLTTDAKNVAPVLRNQKLVKREQHLQPRDLIQLGECILCFLPFCDENFTWSDNA
jgi:hypothetical protein